jgi:DNA-directed RNA polymerase subunit RPC12/RpoP
MFIQEFIEQTRHVRRSKLGAEHEYVREKTMCLFRCDSCDREFMRARGSMNPKRLSNNYFHVCKDCDAKRFAQRKGVERKQVWNLSASSSLPIGKL